MEGSKSASERLSFSGARDQALSMPADLLRPMLAEIPGIQVAFIYGSFARADVHSASDVDVFVLGEGMERVEVRQTVAAAALRVSGCVGREVNVIRHTPKGLAARLSKGRSSQFIKSMISGDKDWLVGDESVLRELVSKVV